jgi:hypothetical protein
MTASRVALLACLLALAVAAPAAALSGSAVSVALHGQPTAKETRATVHTCHAGRNHGKRSAKTAVSDPRNTPVVACEQPPRSEVKVPTLQQVVPNAISAFG